MATADWEEDEWELVNDDGFVYKRKKRPRLDPSATATAVPPQPDPAAEERSRRERRRRALVKLREKYQKEIEQWEHLSNMLRALQEKAPNQHLQEQTTTATASSDSAVNPPEQSSESAGERLVEELLLRAEAEEAVIQDMSNLCDLAEAICNVQEEEMKQLLIDLPVWASPHKLMASLCDN